MKDQRSLILQFCTLEVDELKQALLSAIRIQHPQLLETMIERMCRLDGRFIPFYTCPYWSEAAWVEDPWRHLKGNVKHEYINNRTIDQLLHDVLNGLYGGVSRNIGVGGDPREHPGSMQQVRVVCICALIPPPQPHLSACGWAIYLYTMASCCRRNARSLQKMVRPR